MINMDRNEFIAKLQMVYVGDRNTFNEIVGVYDELDAEIKEDNDIIVWWNNRCNSLMNQRKELKEENQRLQLALKNSKLSHKNIVQKSENQKEEIKRLYEQRKKLWKRKAFLGKENQRLNNVLNELEKLTINICENCYEDRETERIKKRIKELKESDK